MRRRVNRDVLADDGPPVRVSDVARWAGFSKDKLLDDARRGELVITWQRCGTKLWAFVERHEAARYLERIQAAA